MRDAVIEANGRVLAATIVEPAGDSAHLRGLLFAHGLGSDQRRYRSRAAAACRALNAVCVTFDLTGFGDSERTRPDLRLRDHLADVVAAYDRLVANARVDPARVGSCGASYGAYLVARLAAERPVQRLLLRAPALYDDSALDEQVGTPAVNPDAEAPKLFLGLGRSGAEVLVLESEHDEVVPHGVVDTYLENCPRAQHAVIAGATHALTRPEWDAKYVARILSWFTAL